MMVPLLLLLVLLLPNDPVVITIMMLVVITIIMLVVTTIITLVVITIIMLKEGLLVLWVQAFWTSRNRLAR